MSPLRRWGPLALAVAVTLVATSVPFPPDVSEPMLVPMSDKAVHFGLYLWMGWGLGVGVWAGDSPSAGRFLLALLAVAAFAALDEWHQAWIPTRDPALLDWAADVVGSGLGLALALRLVPDWALPESEEPGRAGGGPEADEA